MKMVLLLVVAAVASALGVVYMKYQTRLLFSEVQHYQQVNETYEEELAQLQFEQNRLSDRERIEQLAQGQIGMRLPEPGMIISITPQD